MASGHSIQYRKDSALLIFGKDDLQASKHLKSKEE